MAEVERIGKIKDKRQIKNIINIDEKWEYKLYRKPDGSIAKTINNFCIILENDERFKNKILFNEISCQTELIGKDNKKRIMEEVDYDRIQKVIEMDYKLYDSKKFESALRDISDSHSYNSIKDYLESLKWDGIKRIDTAFADYFGAERNDYNAMCMRVILSGAIERIYNPGAKFDYMFIIKGAQGLGKSTFFRIMCGDQYYQDDNIDINSEKTVEKTRGKWIVEMSELVAMKKTEIERLKSYITTRSETYRIPYGKFSKDFPRRFILIGTTNEERFLIDDTGERRFPIIEATFDKDRTKLKKNLFDEKEEENIKQILAEAFYEYKNGKKMLLIPSKFQKQVEEIQARAKEEDYRVGIIENFLEDKDYCCPFEIWCEAFNHSKKEKYPRTESSKIINILKNIGGWRLYNGNKEHKKRISVEILNYQGIPERHDYGLQVCYERYPSLEEIRLQKEKEEKESKRKDGFTSNLNKLTNQDLKYEDYVKEIK